MLQYIYIKLSYVLYCIVDIRYNLKKKKKKLYLLHNLFSCNCKEAQVDTHNVLSFWMFRISLVLLIIIGSNRYSLPIILSPNSYSNACLQILSKSFAWLLDSI